MVPRNSIPGNGTVRLVVGPVIRWVRGAPDPACCKASALRLWERSVRICEGHATGRMLWK